MRTSESIKEVSASLAKAQAEMSNPAFDSVNPHLKNQYASLASVRNAVVPVMAKHGISVIQELTSSMENKTVACSTILTHASGEFMEFGPLTIPASKFDAQGMGAAATYARRYALLAVAGVSGDSDDDAEGAKKPEKKPDTETLTYERFDENKEAWKGIVESGKKNAEQMIAFLGSKAVLSDNQKAIIKGWENGNA